MHLFRPRVLALSGVLATASALYRPAFCVAMSTASQSQSQQQQGVDQFLSSDYQTKGSIFKLKDDTEFYGSGKTDSKRAVILIPDTYGWNSGRIRNISDYFGENKVFSVVPRLLGGTKEGGEAKGFMESHSIGEFFKSQQFDGSLKPKIQSLVQFLQSEGVEQIAIVGFSWGGWVAATALADPEICSHLVCGVLAHPSINLEERMYGGSLLKLFSHINRPVLVFPAEGDPEEYIHFVRMLKFKCPTSDVIEYYNQSHGFLLRSNENDQSVNKAVIKALNEMLSYINYNFDQKMEDLVHEVGPLSRDIDESSSRVGHGMWASAMAIGQSVLSKTKEFGQSLWEGAKHTTEKIQEGASQTGQYIKEETAEGYEKVKEGTQQGYENVKDKAQQAGQYTKETAQQGYDKAKEGTAQAGQKAKEGYQNVKEGAADTAERTKQSAQQTGQDIGEATKRAGDRIQEAAHRTGEGIKQQSGGAGDKGKSERDKGK